MDNTELKKFDNDNLEKVAGGGMEAIGIEEVDFSRFTSINLLPPDTSFEEKQILNAGMSDDLNGLDASKMKIKR